MLSFMCMASLIFNWKLVEAESRILKKPSEERERQFSEPFRYLRTFARKFSNIDFFLKIIPLKDELVMTEI